MTEKLLPCPFCGFDHPQLRGNGMGDYYVVCKSPEPEDRTCGASTSDRRCETPEGAAKRWNTRATGWRPIEEAHKDGTPIMVGAFQADGTWWWTKAAWPTGSQRKEWKEGSQWGRAVYGHPTHFQEITPPDSEATDD